MSEKPVAVVDIGSNSARVVVYDRDAAGQLHILASTRAALRLVREVDRTRNLGDEAIGRALEALTDFRAIALGKGASRIVAVATAAMRDAGNGPAFIDRIRRELGFEIEIIDGNREAQYGFLGGVHGLPVEHGLLFDLGGGSMQVSRFRDRRLVRAWSLPLGALRLSGSFLAHDPPTKSEVQALRKHTGRLLEEAGVPRLKDEDLVGTGGTVRNLAKIDGRASGYPIRRVHGYVLARGRVHEIAADLASRSLKKRERVPGLSGERGDSIVGGALAVETLMETVGAGEIHVSGQGVREGLALSLFSETLAPPQHVREASIGSLTSRFAGWDAAAARRRTHIADALLAALVPKAEPDLREAVAHAATILDTGRSVDFFDRYEHVAEIVTATELDGFSHRDLALLAAIVRGARDEGAGPRLWSPLLGKADREPLEQAAVILALADDIEERCPRGAAVDLECRVRSREVVVSVPALAGWRPRAIGERFERVFGKALVVRPGGAR